MNSGEISNFGTWYPGISAAVSRIETLMKILF